jgi:hypothetical protein
MNLQGVVLAYRGKLLKSSLPVVKSVFPILWNLQRPLISYLDSQLIRAGQLPIASASFAARALTDIEENHPR